MKPVLSIWTKPVQTFNFLSQQDPKKNRIWINVIIFLTSIPMMLQGDNLGIITFLEENSWGLLIATLLMGGLFWLLLFNTIITYAILWTSKLLEGKANANQIRLILAYSMIPWLIHFFPRLIWFVIAIIKSDYSLMMHKIFIIDYIINLYVLRGLVYGLSFFNKYTFGYAYLSLIIPMVIFQVLIYWIQNKC